MKPAASFCCGTAALLLLAVSGATWVRAQASAQPAEPPTKADPLTQLENALQKERSTQKPPSEDSTFSSRRHWLEDIRQELRAGRDDRELIAIGHLTDIDPFNEVQQACNSLGEQARKRRADKEAAFVKSAEAVLGRASEVLVHAKEPKELDALLKEIIRVSDERPDKSNEDADTPSGRLIWRLRSATQFVDRWQDYLFAVQRGDHYRVTTALQNLADNTGTYSQPPLLARSEILARIPPERNAQTEAAAREAKHPPAEINAAVAVILEHTNTLDEVPAALRKLLALREELGNPSSNEFNTDLGAAINGLQRLQKTQLELQSGLAATISLSDVRAEAFARPAIENCLVLLRAELIGLAAPRLMNAPGDKPTPGEGTTAFLRRLIEAAKKRSDWAAVVRGLDISQTLAMVSGSMSGDLRQSEGFHQFFAGLNMEGASQYEQAVIAYLGALKSGAQDLPTPLIGERLAALEKGHPTEYAAARAYVLNPPASTFPPGMVGPRMPSDPRFGRPGESTTPSPTLIFPATVPTPAGLPPATAKPTP